MNIKNLKIYKLLFVAALVISACDKEGDLNSPEANHRVIVTSEMNFGNAVNIGGKIDFGDVSSGVSSRTWTFPEGVVDIANSDNDVTSNESVVKAFFNTVGEHEVKLHQVFKGAAYDGTSLEGTEMDTTIVVTVLDKVKASIKANYINTDGSLGAELNMTDLAQNEVTASRSIRLTYEATGEPLNFVYEIEGGDPLTISNPVGNADVKYKKMGTYDLKFIASRARPFGADTIFIKDFVKVIPSTDPVILENITNKGTDVAMVFSREMDASTISKANFSVKITTAKGAVINPAIQKVSVDATEGNIVLISLNNETMYDDDVVTVSYEKGTLNTLDAVAASAFSAVKVNFVKKPNLFATSGFSDVDYSFENSTVANFPYLWWGGEWGEYDLAMSSAKAYEGSKSAYVELRPNGGMIIGNKDASGNNINFKVEKGKYEMGVWIYAVELGAPTGTGLPNLRFYWTPDTNWSVPSNPDFTASYPVGKWVYSSAIVEFTASANISLMIRGHNPINAQKVKFYMDNLTLSKLTSRP